MMWLFLYFFVLCAGFIESLPYQTKKKKLELIETNKQCSLLTGEGKEKIDNEGITIQCMIAKVSILRYYLN